MQTPTHRQSHENDTIVLHFRALDFGALCYLLEHGPFLANDAADQVAAAVIITGENE
jgi:hypothetical protein